MGDRTVSFEALSSDFLRAHPPEEREAFNGQTAIEAEQIINPIFTDPVLQGAVDLEDGGEPSGFWPDRLVWVEYDFDTFMPTDQEVIDAGAANPISSKRASRADERRNP